MTEQFLRDYFGKNGGAWRDKFDRPDVFKVRVNEALANEELSRQIIKDSGVFGQAVVELHGKAKYRFLQDRENKSPLLLRAEESLRSQNRQSGGRGPIEKPAKVDSSQPDSADILASDVLCGLAGLPIGSSFNACLQALKSQDQQPQKS